MALPNFTEAVVDESKLTGYLLSATHPLGRFKAQFFEKLGFTAQNWGEFRDTMLAAVALGESVSLGESPYGEKFEVLCTLVGPTGRSAQISTIWVVRHEEQYPRFVTAYPAGRS
jgi:hypothetical protein